MARRSADPESCSSSKTPSTGGLRRSDRFLIGLHPFERVVFGETKPRLMIVTTPNVEFNVRFETLPAGRLRHRDHRFEWTRAEFQTWAGEVTDRYGYTVRFLPIGPDDPEVGSPTPGSDATVDRPSRSLEPRHRR